MKLSLLLAFNLTVSSIALGAEGEAPMPAAAADTETPVAPSMSNNADAAGPAAADASANGQEAVCKNGKDTRRVKLDLANSKCLVVYLKETENPGVENKLWEYNHEIDKCKQNYTDFVEKLRGMSWTCS